MNSVAVFVEHFRYPPTDQFVMAIRNVLTANFGTEPYVTTGRRMHDQTHDVPWCVRYGMERAETLSEMMPSSRLAASVVPLQLEVESEGGPIRQNMVFISARNSRGNEWVYAHFIGKIRTPLEVTQYLAESVNNVLEERGSLKREPTEDDVIKAVEVIDAILTSVTYVLANGTHRVLQS